MGGVSYSDVLERMAAACDRVGRTRDSVRLLVVSKGHTIREIATIASQGHADFGENRAQELRDKVDAGPPGLRWHFVGPLQTNKVRTVRPAVTALHSMDRESLALAWLKGPGAPPPVFVQVNIGEEEQKSGVAPSEAGSFCGRVIGMGIRVIGLMAIPPLGEAEEARPFFARLATIRDEISAIHPSVAGLSMGMSNDFETAIEEGATVIRVGRAIFAD